MYSLIVRISISCIPNLIVVQVSNEYVNNIHIKKDIGEHESMGSAAH